MNEPTAPAVVTLTYDQEGGGKLLTPKRVKLSVTPDLARVFARAALVNARDSTALSFTSLLVGMLTGTDTLSVWLKAELERHGVTAKKIAESRSRSYNEASLHSLQSTPTELATSVSARRAIEEAQTIAAALDNGQIPDDGPALDVRHLAAAYPILRDWHVKDFEDLGIDRLAWCRAFGGFMAKSYVSEKPYWSTYADRAAPVPLTSFSADVYTEKDLLDIDRTVDALALLIASTRTETPLSIGVFGPWGSGKSFFMRHLRKKIWGLAEREQGRVSTWIDKRDAGKATAADAPLYYGQIAQVEFNAWHYNEGNLVASLVDHLFRNLRVLPGAKDTELEQRRAEVLLQLSGAEVELAGAATALERTQEQVVVARGEVERAKEDVVSARKDVDTKAKELEDSSSQAEKARKELDVAIQAVAQDANAPDAGSAVAVAVRQLTDSPVVANVRAAGETLLRGITDWRTFGARLFSVRGAVVLALLLVAPVVAWLTHWLTGAWATLVGGFAALSASMTRIVGFIRERRKEFEAKLRQLEEEEAKRIAKRRAELEKKQAEVQAEWTAKVAALRATLEEQQAILRNREAAVASAVRSLADQTKDLDAKVAKRSSAEVKLREVEARLKQLSSALLLDEFIKDRSGTDEYRKQLSFLALVRRDFERLSDLIAAANEEWSSPQKQGRPPLLNRIVLYIDDLDRCDVDTVLKVLEAVHLLLAFPLFVCVVAVDPRWIEKCLRQKHQYLFGGENEEGGARATVGDYLEKIFQIPIWMSPIDPAHRAAVVKSLLGNTAAPEPKSRQVEAQEALRGAQALPDRIEIANAADGFQAAVRRAEENPDPLRITRDEALFVDRVKSLLSDKPRALIRFVNIYRLLKASLPDVDQQTFVSADASSPYRICISQLAFFTGHPRLGPLLALQVELANGDDIDLRTWFDKLPDNARGSLTNAFDQIPDAGSIRLLAFRTWLPCTSKYLFHRDT
ncbi:MAG TPA: P-loop NTPase fold protein [Thermoanaerobaculia bacterium]